MIVSFRSRALQRFWERSEVRRLPQRFVPRIAMILDRLDTATTPGQMDAPGLGFHALRGDMKGRFSVFVTANWRITCNWSDEGAVDVDLEDYH